MPTDCGSGSARHFKTQSERYLHQLMSVASPVMAVSQVKMTAPELAKLMYASCKAESQNL